MTNCGALNCPRDRINSKNDNPPVLYLAMLLGRLKKYAG
jgi:hypothetical protein